MCALGEAPYVAQAGECYQVDFDNTHVYVRRTRTVDCGMGVWLHYEVGRNLASNVVTLFQATSRTLGGCDWQPKTHC